MSAYSARTGRPTSRGILALLENVLDPEIPVLSVVDLGLVRDIRILEDGVEVSVAPTYTACPATEVIERTIVSELAAKGIPGARVKRVLSPPWTTDWISEQGRQKLAAYGIAPPERGSARRPRMSAGLAVKCPRCEAADSVCISEFGSTPCKASYRCNACLEPFEYFKCI